MLKKLFNATLVIMMMMFFTNVYAADLHCNPTSKICHKKGSKNYDCKGCTKKFASEAEALKNGYRMSKQEKKEDKKPEKKEKKKTEKKETKKSK